MCLWVAPAAWHCSYPLASEFYLLLWTIFAPVKHARVEKSLLSKVFHIFDPQETIRYQVACCQSTDRDDGQPPIMIGNQHWLPDNQDQYLVHW